MKKIGIVALITIVIILAAVAARIAEAPKEGAGKIVAMTSTIEGTVFLGPTCPVEKSPPDPKCAPKGYETTVEIRQAGNSEIFKSISTDSAGSFSVLLPAGTYDLLAKGGNPLPACSPITVDVKPSATVDVELECDTGIR